MNPGERGDLLNLLKTLAQEQRLMMVGFMSEREYTVTEMAKLLELSEPTISHHVSKLHSAGLLRLRMAGNQRFYSLNTKRLNKFREYVGRMDTLPTEPERVVSDDSWIEALNMDEDAKKVLRTHTFNGRLIQHPTKDKRWIAVLTWLATLFEQDKQYTEKEVNEIIKTVNDDYATLRRYLVEFGFMRRERGGSKYWLAPENE